MSLFVVFELFFSESFVTTYRTKCVKLYKRFDLIARKRTDPLNKGPEGHEDFFLRLKNV